MRKASDPRTVNESRSLRRAYLAAIAAVGLLLAACSTPAEDDMPNPALTESDIVFAAAAGSTEIRQLSGSTVSGTIVVSMSHRDYVRSVAFYLDGTRNSNLIRTDSSEPYDVTIDTTKLKDGPHYLVSRTTVKTRRGNRTYDFRANFTVNNAKPTDPEPPTDPNPPTEPADPTEPTDPPGTPGRSGTELRGDPNFNSAQLGPDARLWYDRYWAGLKSTSQYPNVMQSAASGDLYQIGRYVNVHVTSMLSVMRYTGDLKLLDEIDRIMQTARGTLKDTNGDGYLNWRWLQDPKNTQWYGDDRHEMDESITHGFIAAVAWAYQANRDLRSPGGVNYAERADFWTSYLKNNFEAKWRARSRVSASSMSFLNSYLLHTWIQYTRYFWYMGKLTGNSAYTAEAERRNARLELNLKQVTVNGKSAYVYPWGMVSEGNAYPDLMPVVYGQYVVQAAQDMALDGSKTIDMKDLELFANGTTNLIMTGENSFAPTVGGSSSIGGYPLKYNEGPKTGEQWVIYAYAPALVTADASGKIATNAKALNAKYESNQDAPRRIFMSAAALLDALVKGR